MLNNWMSRLKLAQAERTVDPKGFWSGLESFVMVAKNHRNPNDIIDHLRTRIRNQMFGRIYGHAPHSEGGVGNVVHYRSNFFPDLLIHVVYFSDDTICVDSISSRVSTAQTNESLEVGETFADSLKKLGIKLKNPSDRLCPGGGNAQRVFIEMMGLADMVAPETGVMSNAAQAE
jgi:hypothetical protein